MRNVVKKIAYLSNLNFGAIFTPPLLRVNLLKICLLTILFFFPFINSSAQTTFNSSDGKLTFTVTGANTVSVKAASTDISGAVTIPPFVFNGGESYRVTEIASRGFFSCTNLTSIIINNLGCPLTSIKDSAFRSCTNLNSISIPNSVTSIGKSAFYGCKNLAGTITIHSSITSIEEEVFYGCESLTGISIPSSVTSIGKDAFSCSGLTSVTIPNSVTSIKDSTFRECSRLTSVTIGNSVTSIGKWAFYRCSSLTSVTIGNSVTSIGEGAFLYCESLASVTIPNSVTSIGKDAFSCSGLTSVTIPNSITSIADGTFLGCNSLTSITLQSATPPTLLGTYVFTSISSSAVFYVPAGSVNVYKEATNWSTYASKIQSLAEFDLTIGRWNFVAGTGKEANYLNTNYPFSPNNNALYYPSFTTSNTDITTTNYRNCDIAALGYDYSSNAWNTTFMYADETMDLGAGYFVWAFKENAKGTEITSNNTTTQLQHYLKTDGSVNYTTSSNTGTATGSGLNTGYWYSFGNPFDKSLSVSSILSSLAGTTVQGSMVYTFNGTDWNELSSGNITAGQGFMVASAEENKSMNFSTDYPTTNSLPVNVSKTTENRGIKFSLTANGLDSYLYAKQMTEAQDDFDINDAYIMFSTNENKVEPYFVIDNNAVKHNRYNSDNYACGVNFHAQKSGVAELSVSDVPEGTTVSIVDLTMNTETVLESEPYQINIEAGENANRYQIKINKGSVSLPQTIENEANITIWNNNKEIFVKGENLQRVEVYNTLGQMVYQKAISGESYNFTFANEGAYIVKATAAGCSNGQSHVNNCTKTQKIVIR